MGAATENGIVSVRSKHSVEETVQRIEAALEAKGVTLFALIDHSGEAERAGLRMLPAKLLIFGNPRVGTAWMVARPSMAIDLPLKMLVSEDGEGRVWISYDDPAFLQARHHLPEELYESFRNAGLDGLAARAGG